MTAAAPHGPLVVDGLRRDRAMRVAATAVFIATLVMIGGSLVVWGGLGFPRSPMSFVRGPLGVLEISLLGVVYAAVGAFLIGRVPGYIVGWSLIVIGVGVGLHLPVSLMVGQATRVFHPIPGPLLVVAWSLTSVVVPMAAAAIAVLVMVLPDGRLPSHRWRMVIAATLSGFVLLAAGSALTPSGLIWFPTLPNPVPVPMTAGPAVAVIRVVGVGLLALGLGLAATCLLAKYRRGSPVLRRQLGWILVGAVFWAISLAALLFSRYLLVISDADGTMLTHVAAVATLAVPIAILIATIRYQLFGAQVIVSRTLVYVPLLAICSGIYAAGVALSQRLFVLTTGNASDLAVIIATLMAAGAIMPLRRWLETLVDRIMAPVAAPPPADPALREQAALAAEADALVDRLAEIEAQLAALTSASPEDQGRAAGEPGVGRSGWAHGGSATATPTADEAGRSSTGPAPDSGA